MIVGLLVCGCFLLLAGWMRHLLRPNAMVRLGSILRRNVLLLSLCLCGLRFSLLASTLLVPQVLGSIRGLLPLQFRDRARLGRSAEAPVRTGSFAVACELDLRILLADGFGVMCLSCYSGMQLSSEWSRGNFLLGELLLGLAPQPPCAGSSAVSCWS